ncbi:MAG: EAL domain-containing protein [Polyangiaceae bacterium]|nr:EAL domain-containing protein [Polyangiaceae bacterium]
MKASDHSAGAQQLDVPGTIPPGSGAVAKSGTWLDDLLQSDHLHVAFQPIINLHTAEIIGREVLGRIGPGAVDARAHGVNGPAALIEIAHAQGKLLALDHRFREIGIQTFARAGADGTFFLNIDPRVIDDPAFSAGFTRHVLEEHGVAPTRIVLELTESGAVLDSERLERIVRHYTDQGFRIALDDVGAGYASLSALLRVRPHYLKIDKNLVRHVAIDPMRMHLLRAIADFGARAGMQVIAEGIEDEQDLAALVACNIEFGQGYFFARPTPELGGLPPHVQETVKGIAQTTSRTSFPTRTLGTIAQSHPAMHQSMVTEEVASLLRRKVSYTALAVVDSHGRAIGLLSRERLFAEMAHAHRGGRRASELMDPHPLRLDANTSIEVAVRLAGSRDESRAYDPVIVEQAGHYLGMVSIPALMRALADGHLV